MRTQYVCLLLALCIGVRTPPVKAQVVLPDHARQPGVRESIFGLGLAGGAASGLGLSFRHHLPRQVSYQVTGGIIKASEKLSYDIGLEVQYDLTRTVSTRFYAAGAAAYFYTGRDGKNMMDAPGRFGLGLGGELSTGSDLHAMLDLMFTYFTDGTVLPLPQIGLYYYFN